LTINVYKPKKSDIISHTFSIYSNSQEKLDAGFQFLIEGLEKDESILFVTDDLSKEEIIESALLHNSLFSGYHHDHHVIFF